MNSENSRTNESQRSELDLSNRLDLMKRPKQIEISNLSNFYT